MKTNIHTRLIKDFIDVIILQQLRTYHCPTGYDLIKRIHQKFHMLISSGTVYSTLYSLERQGFVKGNLERRRRVYKLTKEGEEFLDEIRTTERLSQTIYRSIFA